MRSTSTDAPVIVVAHRTAIATRGGRFAFVPAEQLAASVLVACMEGIARETSAPTDIGDVVLGNCMGPGGNIARLSSLAAGLDVAVPAMTVDRQCGSGLSAIISTAEAIRGGDGRPRLAGGVESASTAPTRIAHGAAYARAPFAPAGFPDPEMGPAAQALASRYGISRTEQDSYAERSHRLALTSQQHDTFDAEIVEVAGIRIDDGPREGVAAMLPRFRTLYPASDNASATVTAGNSTRISDGAAAVGLVPAGSRGSAAGLALIASATVGCDPALPGIGPVAAVERLLADTGITLADITAIEMVEAFSAQTLAVLHLLGLATSDAVDARVCGDGGALALGHPWGASGAVSVVRLFSRLVRAGSPAGALGIATAAIGGGMGVAALFEVVR